MGVVCQDRSLNAFSEMDFIQNFGVTSSHLLLFVCPSAHMGQGLGLILPSFGGGGKAQNDKIYNHRFKKIRLTCVIFSI